MFKRIHSDHFHSVKFVLSNNVIVKLIRFDSIRFKRDETWKKSQIFPYESFRWKLLTEINLIASIIRCFLVIFDEIIEKGNQMIAEMEEKFPARDVGMDCTKMVIVGEGMKMHSHFD